MTTPDSAPSPVSPVPETSRRALLLGAGAVAAIAGLGVAWWRHAMPPASPVLAGTPPPEGFWQAEWATPQGTTLSMKSLVGRPLLLNFWATWCPPCVEELPLINDFYVKNKVSGWQVLGLAVDKLAPVQAFLQRSPLDFPVGMAGLAGAELSRSMGNPAGALPFSAVLGADGSILHRKLGRVTPEELALWAGLK